MNITQIEKSLKKLIKKFNKETFIYDLLLAYNLPKATITRLQKGSANLSKVEGEVSLKKKLFFKEEYKEDLHLAITKLVKEIKHDQRFVIVTDYKTLLAIDTKTNDSLDIPFNDIVKNPSFFLPWAGMEKAQYQDENPADVKAAVKMAKLFDEIKSDNPDDSEEFIHELNVFLTRLLFCFFAEDTNIFDDNQFTYAIKSHTQADGSDLSNYLDQLFTVLNTPENKRKGLPEYLNSFPYVNGGLFENKYRTPIFSSSSRKAIIESGDQDWSAINPDIFGSMFQAVISVDQRGSLGQHYTSVPNIMKVIEPLFLNDLKEDFEKAKGSTTKLNKLLYRLKNIKIFDPACGSGNFLIIAYKELRRLEMEVFKELGSMALSEISLSQFYGIEIDDFAHEIAILALWLVEHQMNVEFFKEFGRTKPALPLKEAGQIVQGNATRLDWEKVCSKDEINEVYILGNPPYLGQRNQSKNQRQDLNIAFEGFSNYKNLDYVSCWFIKASLYIKDTQHKYSFVSTNSITQGTQVELLWPKITNQDLEIFFAYKDFEWGNNAKEKAGVTVCIIGVCSISNNAKKLYLKDQIMEPLKISPYLTSGDKIIVSKRYTLLSSLPKMEGGNQPREGGYLVLSDIEKTELLCKYPDCEPYVRKLTGAKEVLNNIARWCIWIKEDEVNQAKKIPELNRRIELVRERREKGNTLERNFINFPYRFVQINEALNIQLIIPIVSSHRREYIPIGYLEASYITLASVNVIYDPEPYVFSIISSKMHNLWAKEFAHKLRNDIRYSAGICYNSFPFPDISKQRKEELIQCTLNIIDERLKHSEKTLTQLYDPDNMPEGLREAHHQNDLAVERCYRSTPFISDEERLEFLFKLYKKMVKEEKDSGTLFAKEKKTRKKK